MDFGSILSDDSEMSTFSTLSTVKNTQERMYQSLGDLSAYLNTVTVGDCADLLTKLPDDCIQLTVTSPPYGDLRDYKGYEFSFEKIAAELYRVTEKGGVVVWVVGDETKDSDESGESMRQALHFKSIGFKLYDTMIYAKSGFRFPRPRAYHGIWEYMFVLSKGIPRTVNLLKDRKNLNNDSSARSRKHAKRERDGSMSERKPYEPAEYGVRYNIWEYTVGSSVAEERFAFAHPALFPEKLASDHILSWSNPGDIVLDPMSGSGTTLKMAKQLGRQFIGFEISQEYVDTITRRKIETANTPLFEMEFDAS